MRISRCRTRRSSRPSTATSVERRSKAARVNAGQTLLTIVSDEVWIVANYKETQLRGIAAGAAVAVHVDAIPGVTLHGSVESFSPASGAQFSLLPPDNATGNFTKVVQRVPVKILLAADDLGKYRSQLLPGLSTTTEIHSQAPAR
jgi:membrane fusion protein (multidrug efflux system)